MACSLSLKEYNSSGGSRVLDAKFVTEKFASVINYW